MANDSLSALRALHTDRRALQPQARLTAVKTDDGVKLEYSSKPRSVSERIFGMKEKVARKELVRLLTTAGVDRKTAEFKSAKSIKLTGHEIDKLLRPILTQIPDNANRDTIADAHNNLERLNTRSKENKETPYFTAHNLPPFLRGNTRIAQNESLWSTDTMRSVRPLFGAGLTVSIVKRIYDNGHISSGDEAELRGALMPSEKTETDGYDF